MTKRVDLAGQRFGRLIVVGLSSIRVERMHYDCVCDCGNRCTVLAGSLRSKNTKSCGCYKREQQYKRIKHGHARKDIRPPEYTAWTRMIGRCYNSRNPDWKHYGGRGVIVCDAWRDSYDVFYKDMGPRPSKNHSLDKDSILQGNKVYCPEYCCWATKTVQISNRRFIPNPVKLKRNYLIWQFSKTSTPVQIIKSLGISRDIVYRSLSMYHQGGSLGGN